MESPTLHTFFKNLITTFRIWKINLISLPIWEEKSIFLLKLSALEQFAYLHMYFWIPSKRIQPHHTWRQVNPLHIIYRIVSGLKKNYSFIMGSPASTAEIKIIFMQNYHWWTWKLSYSINKCFCLSILLVYMDQRLNFESDLTAQNISSHQIDLHGYEFFMP